MDDLQATAASPAAFPKFRRLPAEIRIKIWKLCLPGRVTELDRPPQRALYTKDPLTGKISNCRLVYATSVIQAPPLIAQVCYESREIALENGFRMDDLYVNELKRSYRDFSPPDWSGRANAWFQPDRDILHLNWTKYTDQPNPLSEFVFLVDEGYANDLDKRPSIMTDLLFDGGYYHDPRSPLSGPGTADNIAELSLLCRGQCRVVITTINIHIPLQVARQSGLFGLLCEAPIQLVDPTDLETIVAFFRLYKGHDEMRNPPVNDVWCDFREILGLSSGENEIRLDTEDEVDYKLSESFLSKVEDWVHFLEYRYLYGTLSPKHGRFFNVMEFLEQVGV
ncbi:hypothetical protein QBC37DRAFT_402433 [Rhypophila decipiens]|uniref:2EXR domain-containing protein n=1 Tax=Rhypophila decipiens TaxID=261697 RepID=A0AAN7B5W7_9PEZI|nr:hypothetical protein QBC37DRAFT_402433 [Rhypophila decipiens]